MSYGVEAIASSMLDRLGDSEIGVRLNIVLWAPMSKVLLAARSMQHVPTHVPCRCVSVHTLPM